MAGNGNLDYFQVRAASLPHTGNFVFVMASSCGALSYNIRSQHSCDSSAWWGSSTGILENSHLLQLIGSLKHGAL